MIGVCGFACLFCPYRFEFPEKAKILSEVLNILGKEGKKIEKLSDIRCRGCLEGSIVIKNCEVRECALKRGYKTCLECPEAPCEKLKRLLRNHPDIIEAIEKYKGNIKEYLRYILGKKYKEDIKKIGIFLLEIIEKTHMKYWIKNIHPNIDIEEIKNIIKGVLDEG